MASEKKPMSLGSLITNVVITSIFFPALMLALGGDWRWIEGWIFGLWIAAMIVSVTVYLFFKDPMLLQERTQTSGGENRKTWDKYLLVGIYVIAILWLVIMPLDAKRFGWSPAFPVWLKVIGGIALLPSLFLIFRATTDNTFLSTRVRIQTERKQRVISTGVYGFVRHPLYLGCVLMIIGAPLLLGSLVGCAVSVLSIIILIARTLGEEKMLVDELEGYEEYRQKVKYRLIPYIW